jgi:biofilm PGA synthesis protein PgaA
MHKKSKIVLAMVMLSSVHAIASAADQDSTDSAVSAPAQSLPITALPASSDDLIGQLQRYDRALLRNPDDSDAHAGRLLTLARLGATDLAIDEAERLPHIAPAILSRLYEDKTALLLRWSENTYYDKPGEDYPGYDQAIAAARANLQRDPASTRSRFYLVRALNDRKHRAEASAIYAELQADAIAIPTEVHASAGAAYLAQQQPERAEQALREALALRPGNFNASIALFYALLDQGKYDAARTHIDALAMQALPSEEKFSAATIAALERAFEGQLANAQTRLRALQAEAPASDQIQMALGKVYLWRGWPRRARAQYELVAARDPDSLPANAALIEIDTVLGRFVSADQRLVQLQASVPEDGDVQKLTRDQRLRNAPELSVALIGTRSSENLASGRGIIVESKLLGSPWWPQTRPFIHEYFERAITDDLHADYRRLGTGLQITLPGRGVLEGEVQQEFYRHPRTSAALSADIALDDQWSVRGRIDSNSLDVPLVARYDEIDGWLAGAGVSYRESERWQVSADLSQLNMSDNNTRRSVLLRGGITLLQTPAYRGRLELELYHASNSLSNTAYYNPASSDSQIISYLSDWNFFQRYERSFGQRLNLSIGRQSERGYSSATIGGISYEQRLSISAAVALNYGFGYVRRIYSGNLSSGPEIHLNLNWKFL